MLSPAVTRMSDWTGAVRRQPSATTTTSVTTIAISIPNTTLSIEVNGLRNQLPTWDELQAIFANAGLSYDDTIVIYDRIRENLRKYRKMAIIPLLNLSLNETLSRTIVTSLSIMLALAVLLILGPDIIFGLTAAILLGTFVGTYSSIYISAPILVWLGVTPDSFVHEDEAVGVPGAA